MSLPGVTGARLLRRTLRLHRPVVTAHGPVGDREVLLLGLSDADGNTGWGEAAPLPGFTPETLDEAGEAILAWLDDGDRADPPATPTARAAVDGALLHLAARAAGMPLHRHLNPDSPSSMAVSALVGGDTAEELAVAGRAAVDAGHRAVKAKVGVLDIGTDVARVVALSDAVGDGVAIRLDANGAWSTDEAPGHLERLAHLGVEFVEEPVAGVEALAALRAASPIPVAADESATTPEGFEAVVSAGAADLVVLKPSAVGGIAVAADLAGRARNGGLGVVVTSLLEGAVGISHAAHLASAIGALDPVPGLATGALVATDVAQPPRLAAGRLHLGLGDGLPDG
mgnify:CR=1 FL=1